jgi:hypothetical protein
VVCTEAALPTAHPVTYHLDGEEIVFRSVGNTLVTAVRQNVVGFQADAFDAPTRTGWSVLGIGVAYEVVDPDRLARIVDLVPYPWAPGDPGPLLVIPLRRLTGRRLTANRSGSDGDHI